MSGFGKKLWCVEARPGAGIVATPNFGRSLRKWLEIGVDPALGAEEGDRVGGPLFDALENTVGPRHLGWGDLAVFDDEDSLAPEFVSLGYPCNVGEASTVNETELVTRGLVEHL